jgi:hypothetical protein
MTPPEDRLLEEAVRKLFECESAISRSSTLPLGTLASLPAHDPSVPKPRGLLPVPQEIEEAVAREEARIAREHGIVIAPEARQRMRDDLTLQYYYEGACVASRRTPQGIEVLAVGRDDVNQYRKNNPPESRMDVRIGIV